ncbi:MAG: DinB family protein [Bryobacteraceae bacterium]
MGDQTRTAFLNALDEAFDRKSWHGTNLRGALRRVTAGQSLWRPAPGRHNIWELAIHCAYWKYAVRRRLLGLRRGSFPLKGSNFFSSPDRATEPEWRQARRLLECEHRLLREAVTGLPESRLNDAATARLLRGIAAHDLYHAGQIQLLRRLQEASAER